MKPITSNLLCATLSLALAMPAQAADETAAGKQDKATQQNKASKRTPQSALPQTLAAHPEATDTKELTGQIVYQVLLAEVALQRGQIEFASQAYADLAMRTRDPKVLERAIEVAGYARRFERVVKLARLWVQVEPDSKRAQQVLVGVLVLTNQLNGLAPRLIDMLAADQPALPGNLLALNRMFARSADRKAVLQLISAIGERFPRLPEAHYAVAVAASSAGENDRALAEVRQALALRPDWQIGALLEAQLLARNSPAEAIASLQSFVAKNPDAREAQLHLARALVGEKRYAEAKRLF